MAGQGDNRLAETGSPAHSQAYDSSGGGDGSTLVCGTTNVALPKAGEAFAKSHFENPLWDAIKAFR